MNLSIQSLDNTDSTVLSVSDKIYSRTYNQNLIHQVLTSYMTNSRQGTKSQKDRSEVSGSGIKPWKQKGSGRARVGSIRSPIWRKGGVVFPSKTKLYKQKINRKMYKAAMSSIFSELLRTKNLVLINSLIIKSAKTKDFILFFKEFLSDKQNILLIISSQEYHKNIFLSSRNLKNIKVIQTNEITPVNLISHNKVIMTKKSVEIVEGCLL